MTRTERMNLITCSSFILFVMIIGSAFKIIWDIIGHWSYVTPLIIVHAFWFLFSVVSVSKLGSLHPNRDILIKFGLVVFMFAMLWSTLGTLYFIGWVTLSIVHLL